MSEVTDRLTLGALLGLSALHLAWGAGSSVPFPSRDDLAEAVVGAEAVPPPAACFAVAGCLGAGAVLVGGRRWLPSPLRHVGLAGMAAVLTARSVVGFMGRTDLVSPGSSAARFRRLDRRLYSPLCAALAAGALVARRPRQRPPA